MSDVPHDIIPNILSRLPVKSLLRFTSVSKPWHSLIYDPHFAKLHLKHMSKTYCTQLIGQEYRSSNLLLGNLEIDSLQTVDIDLCHKFPPYQNVRLLGCLDGLICFEFHENIYIWNPSTKEGKKLPDTREFSNPARERFGNTFHGFGYDSKIEDYKVVKIVQESDENDMYKSSTAMVYTLGTNSWARIHGLDVPILWICETGVAVNGCLNWRGADENIHNLNKELFVSFDFVTEKFLQIRYPENVDYVYSLDFLGGNLCAVIRSNISMEDDVWVMKEYGVEASWTKLFTISQCNGIDILRPSRVLCYNKNGQVVLRGGAESRQLLLYDLVHGKFELIHGDTSNFSAHAYAYQGSLVSVNRVANRTEGRSLLQESSKASGLSH